MTTCYVARMSLGKRGVTQAHFAALTGRIVTLVQKREWGKVHPDKASIAFFDLVIDAADNGLREEVLARLEEIPEGMRSEGRGIIAVLMTCFEHGKASVIDRALGMRIGAVEEEGEGPMTMDIVRHIDLTVRDIERKAKRAKVPSLKARYQQAAAQIVAGVHHLREAYAQEEELKAEEKAG